MTRVVGPPPRQSASGLLLWGTFHAPLPTLSPPHSSICLPHLLFSGASDLPPEPLPRTASRPIPLCRRHAQPVHPIAIRVFQNQSYFHGMPLLKNSQCLPITCRRKSRLLSTAFDLTLWTCPVSFHPPCHTPGLLAVSICAHPAWAL